MSPDIDHLPVEALPNLGPQSKMMLASVGIHRVGELRQLGAVAAYARVKQHHAKASLNLLWALEGALLRLPWQQVLRQHRLSLLLALEAHEQALAEQALATSAPTEAEPGERPTPERARRKGKPGPRGPA